ncbi:Hypothetical_protein [Hexamita inflata]|uniref:Hypothetical_protein n=1 Tax=Hexamita inflata TaxID=28002 RepID=A0AA86S467_9EUKA|nr:Hypothetical protein HINF_LOCUS65380 [Hexamita inflata]
MIMTRLCSIRVSIQYLRNHIQTFQPINSMRLLRFSQYIAQYTVLRYLLMKYVVAALNETNNSFVAVNCEPACGFHECSYSMEPSCAEWREQVVFSMQRVFVRKLLSAVPRQSVLNQTANPPDKTVICLFTAPVPVQHFKHEAKCNSNPPTQTPRDQSVELNMIVLHAADQRISSGGKNSQTPIPTRL